MESQRNMMLSALLDQGARARCRCHPRFERVKLLPVGVEGGSLNDLFTLFFTIVNTIAAVKPDKARAVEDMLIGMARGGQIRGKVWTSRPSLGREGYMGTILLIS
jgi:hypothetical protein